VLIIGGGGAGGEGGAGAAIPGGDGTDTILRNNTTNEIIATARGGKGGIVITTGPSSGNLGKADFSRMESGYFERIAASGFIQAYPIYCSSRCATIEPSGDYALPSTLYGYAYGGFGGTASQNGGVYGEKGMAGGVAVLTCKNTSTTTAYSLKVAIGTGGTTAGGGLAGTDGLVLIWLGA
jgi:hypothetical protein